MTIVLPAVERKKTLGQKLSQGLGRGLDIASQFAQESQQKKLMQQENEQFKKLTGMDISGIQDPKIRQEAFKQAMELQNAPQKFGAQYGAKAKSQLDLINQLGLGGEIGQGQPEIPPSDQINAQGETEIGNVKIPTLIPESKIQKMALINPAVADKMQKHNDNILQQQRHEDTLSHKQKVFEASERERSPEKLREKQIAAEQAKADITYNKELQSAHKQHELKTQTLDKLEKLNNKGVTGKPYEKLLEKFGLINLTSEGRREFAADVKNLITDIRSILGGQFSQFEFQTILNAYPSADFSQDANRAIINNLKEFQDIRRKEFEIANDIKKENGGKIPSDYQSLVNDRLTEYAQSRLPEIKANTRKVLNEEYGIQPGYTLMFDPQGEPLNVPEEMIGQYEEMGATLP